MKPKYCLRVLLCPILMAIASIATGQTNTHLPLTGRIINNETKKAVEGVTVAAVRSHIKTLTNENGTFSIDLPGTDTLLVSGVGYKSEKRVVSGERGNTSEKSVVNGERRTIVIELTPVAGELQEVTVNTGYQRLPKERATGSFDVVGTALLNRRVSTNVLDKIENLTPGVLFDRNTGAPDALLIRGRSTIYANAAPLIVVDNFPYDGDIGNINPNDVESVTILKDAAAASIWGARAGNGVIVITTKKGRTAKPRVELNSNVTLVEKPDLYNVNTISSADYIELEKWLFGQGYYANDEFFSSINFGHPPFTPVVNLLIAGRDSLIGAEDMNREIEDYKGTDARKDMERYLYRTAVNQQHAVSVSGSSDKLTYYMSAGWDKNLASLTGSDYSRVSLRSQTTFTISPRLQVSLGLSYTESGTENGNNPGYGINSGGGKGLYPYARLANDDGSAAVLVHDYSQPYIDTAGGGYLADWTYRPLTDMGQEAHRIQTKDVAATAGIHYNLSPDLSADLRYQYESAATATDNEYKAGSYFARNLINQYSQVDYATGFVTRPIPPGGILDAMESNLTSHQGRAQLNYAHLFYNRHEVTAIAGYEVRDISHSGTGYRLYGYQPENSSVAQLVDYTTFFAQQPNIYIPATIPNPTVISSTTDRFLSFYGNAAYTYDKRYTLSGSARHDAANLFGVAANERGTPLWSAGAGWTINNEAFYHMAWLPSLRLQATYGYSGNISRLATAYTTVTSLSAYSTTEPVNLVRSPPNKELRWERVKMANISLAFATQKQTFSGTIEYYHKRASDLLGQAPLDPTLGVIPSFYDASSYYYGNVANMKGTGVDLQLSSRIADKAFKWYTDLTLSHATSVVADYLAPEATGSAYLSTDEISPVKGKPVYGIYSYRWAGLDPQTGAPQGYFDGKVSEDYSRMLSTTPLDSLMYNGPAQPTWFGALRNTFSWQGFSLSLNISYQLGYYFRTKSVVYSDLYGSWTGSGDYANRWQQPGDETHTHVPARVYPADYASDAFYAGSSVLVERGDHIRLADATFSYDLDKKELRKLPFAHVRVYAYAGNLGVLWTANKAHIDPYYNNAPAAGKSIALGVTITF